MKRKRIIVMGFMGSCPIAGVIWQHIHYIVGPAKTRARCLLHRGLRAASLQPRNFRGQQRITITPRRILDALAREFGFKRAGVFARATCPAIRPPAFRSRKFAQLYREADAILNVCGTQEFNDDLLTSDRILYIESDPGRRADQGRSTRQIDHQISAPPPRPFHLRRKCRHRRLSRCRLTT